MKLKTLKDLTVENGGVGVSYEGLRQEAIKWIKELDNEPTTMEGAYINTRINFRFKKFFNITEEDLK